MSIRAFAATAALVCVSVLAACGGDDAEEEFIADADAICEERYANEPPQTEAALGDPALIAIVEEKIAVFEQERDELAALEAPEELAPEYEEYLASLERRLELGAQVIQANQDEEPVPPAVTQGQAELTAEQNSLADSIGFETCGQGRFANADPEPAEPLDDALATLEQVIAEEDCDLFAEEVILTGQKPIAEQICGAVLTDFEGFTAADAEVDEFGTAAVVQYEGKNDTVSQPFVVEGDQTFRMATYTFQNQPSVGEPAEANAEYESTMQTGIDAIAAEDCDAYEPVADLEAFASADEACGVAFALTPAFDPAPEVEELGTNAYFGFYAVRTDAGNYYTAIVSRKDDDDAQPVRNSYRLSGIEPAFR